MTETPANASDNVLKVVKTASDEAQNHLTSAIFNRYLFNAKLLDADSLSSVEAHIAACEHCKLQVEEVQNNMAFYQSLPSLDL